MAGPIFAEEERTTGNPPRALRRSSTGPIATGTTSSGTPFVHTLPATSPTRRETRHPTELWRYLALICDENKPGGGGGHGLLLHMTAPAALDAVQHGGHLVGAINRNIHPRSAAQVAQFEAVADDEIAGLDVVSGAGTGEGGT